MRIGAGVFRIWLLALFSLVCIRGGAQHMNAKDGPCQVPSTTVDGTNCFSKALKDSDEQLNQMYQRALTVVGVDELTRLKTAQRLWIQYRGANCEAEREMYSGCSAASMVRLACLEAMTRHRTEELRTMYGWRLEKFGK